MPRGNLAKDKIMRRTLKMTQLLKDIATTIQLQLAAIINIHAARK
jgi:hypothetical protein